MPTLHMSWCDGTHTDQGWCCLVEHIGADDPVLLVGMPCDSMRIDLDPGALVTSDEARALIPVLDRWASVMDASAAEVDCDLHEVHNGDDDEDDGDGDDPICGRCGEEVDEVWLVGNGYLCPPCCDAVGASDAYSRHDEGVAA